MAGNGSTNGAPNINGRAYPIEDHSYDVIVVGAGISGIGAGYHLLQSKIALGSGGLFGRGFLEGTQSHLNFLPEKQTDFIFTMLAEEWGLVGGLVLLCVLVIRADAEDVRDHVRVPSLSQHRHRHDAADGAAQLPGLPDGVHHLA